MELDNLMLGADEQRVLLYLNTWPGEFIAEKQIARHAESKQRFIAEPYWARNSLNQLATLGLVEADSSGKYCVRIQTNEIANSKRFIAPHLREILESSGRNIDLSSFAS